MADFYFYGRRVATIFQALPTLGTFEDDMSRGIGSVLSRCPQLLKSFVTKVVGGDFDPEVATVKFQVIDRKTGRTDQSAIDAICHPTVILTSRQESDCGAHRLFARLRQGAHLRHFDHGNKHNPNVVGPVHAIGSR
jgi:hypothetical protein